MKIAFLCASLEPGRDGVGDYTRRLAAECIRQGHQCRIVALCDEWGAGGVEQGALDGGQKTNPQTLKTEMLKVEGRNKDRISAFSFQLPAFIETQQSEGTEVECLRLPGSLGWAERVEPARQWLDDFNPDWVSLQFVPFGFHPKGLPFGLPHRLKDIIGSRPLHWMFHELWVLWSFPLSLRKRLLGQYQKFCLRLCSRKLKPKAVSTQLLIYQAELNKIGLAADVVPLHGNIPVYPKDEANRWFKARCAPLPVRQQKKMGFFGNIYSCLSPALLARWIAEFNLPASEILVLSAGIIRPESVRLWNLLERELKSMATFVQLGALNEREASWYFSSLDYGLTSYEPEVMGKSGPVASMREHGLPVISCGSLSTGAESHNNDGLGNPNVKQPWTVKLSAHFLLQQLQVEKKPYNKLNRMMKNPCNLKIVKITP